MSGGVIADEVIVETVHRPGKVQLMLADLARARLDVHGISAYTIPGGARPVRRVHLLLDDPQEGAAVLKRAGHAVKVRAVFVVPRPALLFDLELALGKLQQAGIEVEALYATLMHSGPGFAIATDDPARAAELLADLVRAATPLEPENRPAADPGDGVEVPP